MEKWFKQLLCKLFDHEWRKAAYNYNDRDVYVCTRCGKEQHLYRGKRY